MHQPLHRTYFFLFFGSLWHLFFVLIVLRFHIGVLWCESIFNPCVGIWWPFHSRNACSSVSGHIFDLCLYWLPLFWFLCSHFLDICFRILHLMFWILIFLIFHLSISFSFALIVGKFTLLYFLYLLNFYLYYPISNFQEVLFGPWVLLFLRSYSYLMVTYLSSEDIN